MASITGTVLALSGNSGYDANNEDFDILRDLLITADAIAETPFGGVGLVNALDTLPDLTVFAPDDEAFVGLAATIASVTGNATPIGEAESIAFLADALTLLGGGDASGLLTEVLTYHVAGELIDSDKLIADGGATMLSGGSIGLNTSDLTLVDADPGVPDPALDTSQLNINVDNGIIHVIEGVLLPAEVSAILTAPGTDFEIGDDGNEYFRTGRGNDFVDGNGGRDVIRSGSGDDVAIGGDGNDWILGGRGSDTLLGEAGHDKIFGGKGNDIINGGSGRDYMSGGRGHDTFVFENGSDSDTLIGFRDGSDKIDLSGYAGIDDFADVEDGISGGWFGTTIHLDDGDSIFLLGVRESRIDESDFIF